MVSTISFVPCTYVVQEGYRLSEHWRFGLVSDLQCAFQCRNGCRLPERLWKQWISSTILLFRVRRKLCLHFKSRLTRDRTINQSSRPKDLTSLARTKHRRATKSQAVTVKGTPTAMSLLPRSTMACEMGT